MVVSLRPSTRHILAMRWQYAPFCGTSTCPVRGTSVPIAASTENVPLPCMGTHWCVPASCTICSRRSQTRAVILLKSTSQEPQSRSMLCLVRSEVVKGPGVSRYGSLVIGLPTQGEQGISPQQRGCLGCEHAGLVDANHFDRGAAGRRGNARLDANT